MREHTYILGKVDKEKPKHTGKITVLFNMEKNIIVN